MLGVEYLDKHLPLCSVRLHLTTCWKHQMLIRKT